MEPRHRLRWLVSIAIVLLGARAAGAQSAERRVALIEPGPALESAARTALEPWNVAVLIVAGPSPGTTAPDTNEAARALAQAEGVNAVVWISDHDGRHALWVYDVETQHVFEAELVSAPPFDDPTAAAVALSIKTLLRYSATAPPSERYGASGSAPTSPAPPMMTIVRPGPTAPIDSATPPPIARRRIARSTLDLALETDLRFNFSRPSAVEPRFGLALIWWPQQNIFGFSLAAISGPGVSVDAARFDGRLIDVTASAALHVRRDVTKSMRSAIDLGPSLHMLVLDGTLVAEKRSTSDVRATPSIDLRQQTDWRLGSRIRLGLAAELAYLIVAERYRVNEQTLLEVSHLAVSVGLVLTAIALE